VAIVGIGSELRGDDAAGVRVAQALQLAVEADRDPPLLIIDAGVAPENFTGTLRRFDPDLVLLIDAAQMNEVPGTIRWIDWQETSGLSASTHTLPPYLLVQYLVSELNCTVALIGIQPQDNEFGAPLSLEVQQAVDEITRTLETKFL
jgi:hydrogenase maturation protease HycI